jgi:hypothetical protein
MDGEQRIKMRIIVCIRSYNEAKNIEKCCEAYPFADKILVADGGSIDNTVELTYKYPWVEVRPFHKKVECKNGIWRNPDGEHINFLLDWADKEGADWVIEQDCDQRPNKHLKQDARSIFEKSTKDFIQVTQLFLWGKEQFFPDLSFQGGGWMQGLWAWRASTHLRVINKMPHFEFTLDGVHSLDINKSGREQNVLPPYCFMHYGWQTEEQVNDHLIYYRSSGLIEGMLHPLKFAGKLAPLPNFAVE